MEMEDVCMYVRHHLKDCMIFISVHKNTNLKINGSRNDIACFLPLVQASVNFRSSVFFPRGYKNIIFSLSAKADL